MPFGALGGIFVWPINLLYDRYAKLLFSMFFANFISLRAKKSRCGKPLCYPKAHTHTSRGKCGLIEKEEQKLLFYVVYAKYPAGLNNSVKLCFNTRLNKFR